MTRFQLAMIFFALMVAPVMGASTKAEGGGPGYEEQLEDGWSLQVWDDKKVWKFCSVQRPYKNQKDEEFMMGFLAGPGRFQLAIVYEKPTFFAANKEPTEYVLMSDSGPMFRGTGTIDSNSVFLNLEASVKILNELAEGRVLHVKFANRSLSLDLDGSRNALNHLVDCFKLGMDKLEGK